MTLREAFPEVGAPVAAPAEDPVRQMLVLARRRVAAGWVQGHSVDFDENGVRYCLLAALAAAPGGTDGQKRAVAAEAYRAVADAVKEHESRPLRRLGLWWQGCTDPPKPPFPDEATRIVRFNDRNRTTQRDVIRVLDRAIERSSE